jgi:hypothetical protein
LDSGSPPRHCEERSDEAIQLSLFSAPKLDCLAEPVIGRRFAPTRWHSNDVEGFTPTRWLATTAS